MKEKEIFENSKRDLDKDEKEFKKKRKMHSNQLKEENYLQHEESLTTRAKKNPQRTKRLRHSNLCTLALPHCRTKNPALLHFRTLAMKS